MRSKVVRTFLLISLVAISGLALAGASLKLGTVFDGWDELRSGNTHRAASALVHDYSAQVGHFCAIPEVFIWRSASSLTLARLSYESALPAATSQRLLVDGFDQKILMVSTQPFGTQVMAVLVTTDFGVLLVLC